MKSFYEWYRKHITGAIFGGLILGILTGLFLAGRFKVVEVEDRAFEGSRERILDSLRLSKRYMKQFVI